MVTDRQGNMERSDQVYELKDNDCDSLVPGSFGGYRVQHVGLGNSG